MNSKPRIFGIVGALIISGALVGGAYFLSGPLPFRSANAASTDELLKSYTAKDTDADGLPDWEEALYGTDPNNPMSFKAGVKDGDAVSQGLIKPKFSSAVPTSEPVDPSSIPGPTVANDSFTNQFAQAFFQAYMETGQGQPLTNDQVQALVGQLASRFSAQSTVLYISSYTLAQVHTSDTATITDYAAAVERIIGANDVAQGNGDPVVLMEAYLEKDDAAAQKKLVALSASYASITQSLAQVSVPPQLAADHLALMRSFDGLAKATKGVANYQADPLAVLGAIGIYQPSAKQIVSSFEHIADAILLEEQPAAGEPGAFIVQYAQYARSQGL